MNKLQDLFDARFASYSEHSDKILQSLESNVIPAILEVLNLSNLEESNLIWRDVRVIENHIMIIGAIEYSPGDIIKDNETTVKISKEQAKLMSKLVKIAVPLILAETASQAQIKKHLIDSQKQLREEYEAVYGHDQTALNEAMVDATNGQLGWDESADPERNLVHLVDAVSDFDIEELSEKQLESLVLTHMSKHKGGGKLN